MTPPWVDRLFGQQSTLFYQVTLAGQVFIQQWTCHDDEDGGLHRLTFRAVIDQRVAGWGSGRICSDGELLCTAALDPVRYCQRSQGNLVQQLDFGTEQVAILLPDGSTQQVDRAGARFLVDSTFPATMALIYASLADENTAAADLNLKLKVFLVPSLVTVPYETWPSGNAETAAGRWHCTSHRSEVLLDAAGVMQVARVPDAGVEATLCRDAPPMPDWQDFPRSDRPPPVYRMSSGAGFRLEDVEIDGPVTPIGGSLSIPAGPGPFPAVLFIGGSGTHDRHGIAGDIDIGSHEIMDDLAEHGFLGLRFDTRGAGSTRLGADALDRGLASDIADARACLAWLVARPEAAGQPLFLIGHSQGATIALALAGEPAAGPGVQGVVLMAAMGRDLDQILADQILVQGRKLGLSPQQIEAQQADAHTLAQLVRSGQAWDGEQVPHHLLAAFRTPTWYKAFLDYPATGLIRRVNCPILLCQGGADFQISPTRDAGPLLAAARDAGRDCRYLFFPDLDHLFKHSAGQSSLEEYQLPRPVDPVFLARLRAWLASRAGLKA